MGGEKPHFAVHKHFGQGEPEGSPRFPVLIALQQKTQKCVHTDPPGTHTPPLPSSPGHTRARTRGRDHKRHSQDLQIAQRSEGSIFNAANAVVVQLPAGKQRESMKAAQGSTKEPAGHGPPSARFCLSPPGAHAEPACLPRCSPLCPNWGSHTDKCS